MNKSVMDIRKPKVLIAAPVHPSLLAALVDMGYDYLLHEKITQAEAPALLGGVNGIITSTRLLLDKALIDAAPNLQWIGRLGSGMEIVDVAYAAQKGIQCFSSPEGNCNAVSEHVMGLLLSLIRKINTSAIEVRGGTWLRDENRGIELEGKTIGIIGYGHTGHALRKKLKGFDMDILVYDKYRAGELDDDVTFCRDLSPIFEHADMISFHVPLQADTIHYFNQEFLSKLQKRCIIINTSRGRVVDTGALLAGLKSGRIMGACLDVLEEEPMRKMSGAYRSTVNELLGMHNVVITPHIAGYTYEALLKMSETIVSKIKQVAGEK